MAASRDDTLVCLAVVTGAIGVRGEVRVKTFTETIEGLAAYGPLTADLVFENIGRWYAGKVLKNVVDPDLQY